MKNLRNNIPASS